jgi:F-type H+-transporting ATPase subunit gamma
MAKARHILNRANSIKSLRKVTKTMEMVSTARYSLAYNRISAIRPYTERVIDLLGDVLGRSEEDFDHPLLREPEGCRNEVLLVLTSDRGLCGSYNTEVVDLALDRRRQLAEAGYDVELHVLGKRGLRYLQFRDVEIARRWPPFGPVPEYVQAGRIAQEFMDRFLAAEISGLEVAYTRHASSGPARPVIGQVLPLGDIPQPPPIRRAGEAVERLPYELHPSAEVILRNLLPATVRLRLYQCYLDAAVTEQLARIGAMRQATDSADEMIGDLTRQYNRQRQSSITTELSEIVGGSMGVK